MNSGRRDLALTAEAAVQLAAAAALLACLPFRRVAPRFGTASSESPRHLDAYASAWVDRVTRAVDAGWYWLPFATSCLTQAYAAKTLLRRRGIDSTLYLGVDPRSGEPLAAHAWLRSGSVVVTGGGREHYATVASFAGSAGKATAARG